MLKVDLPMKKLTTTKRRKLIKDCRVFTDFCKSIWLVRFSTKFCLLQEISINVLFLKISLKIPNLTQLNFSEYLAHYIQQYQFDFMNYLPIFVKRNLISERIRSFEIGCWVRYCKICSLQFFKSVLKLLENLY